MSCVTNQFFFLCLDFPPPGSGYFSRTVTWFKCNFTVVKTPLYCTGKWSCNLTCTAAMSQLQLPCNSSTGQVPLPEHEISHGTPRICTRCSFRKFRVPGGGNDQLNSCKEAAAGSLLTCRSGCSFISQYKWMGVLTSWSWFRVHDVKTNFQTTFHTLNGFFGFWGIPFRILLDLQILLRS